MPRWVRHTPCPCGEGKKSRRKRKHKAEHSKCHERGQLSRILPVLFTDLPGVSTQLNNTWQLYLASLSLLSKCWPASPLRFLAYSFSLLHCSFQQCSFQQVASILHPSLLQPTLLVSHHPQAISCPEHPMSSLFSATFVLAIFPTSPLMELSA